MRRRFDSFVIKDLIMKLIPKHQHLCCWGGVSPLSFHNKEVEEIGREIIARFDLPDTNHTREQLFDYPFSPCTKKLLKKQTKERAAEISKIDVLEI